MTLVVVADDERGVGKELEGRHDLRPGEGVPAHGDPLLIRERALLSQDVLGHTDLAQVVEQPRLCDGLGLRDSKPRRQREALSQSRHTL